MDMLNLPGNDPAGSSESSFHAPADQDFYSLSYQDSLDGFQHDVGEFLW